MQAKIAKWGNSLGIRIPQQLAEKANIYEGALVEIEVRDETIMIKRNRPSLEELLEKITPENIHAEVDGGSPVGKEIW